MKYPITILLVLAGLVTFGMQGEKSATVTVSTVDGNEVVSPGPVIKLDPGATRVRVQFHDGAGATTGSVDVPIPIPAPPSVLSPPSVLPEFIKTHHDTVWIQGLNYTRHVVQSGRFTDPETWSGKTVPGPADRVRVQEGASVTLDGDVTVDTLVIDGEMRVEPSAKVRLAFTTLTVLPAGKFSAADVSLELVVRDSPIDLARDPGAYGHGILVFGELTLRGREKTPFVRLAGDVAPGATSLATTSALIGWEPGDVIVIPDTRQLGQKERAGGYAQLERRAIQSVSEDGRLVTLAQPLTHAHLGVLDRAAHAANLTRSIVIRSENPAGVTGHLAATYRARLALENVAVVEMGRTLNAPIGPANQIGRYPIHLHHLIGTADPVAGVPQFLVRGCAVDGGTAAHDRKWGIVIHGSHWGEVSRNVVHNVYGAGIMFEDGSETGVVLEDNFVVLVGGDGGRADAAVRQGGIGMQGSGIYVRGPFSLVRRNVACNTTNYGYIVSFFYLGKVSTSAGPGTDSHHAGVLRDGNAGGLAGFDDNEAYACYSGLTLWWVGTYGNKPTPGARESLFRNFTTWNHWEYGVFQYPCNLVTFDGFRAYGTPSKTNTGAAAWYGADYMATGLRVLGADVRGHRTGFNPSVFSGEQLFENCSVLASAGFNLSPPWTSGYAADGIKPKKVTIRNCTFGPPAVGGPFVAIARNFPLLKTLGGRTQNLVSLDEVIVENFQGIRGDDFRVYYDPEQLPDYVVPATIPNVTYGGNKVVGSPEPGLTNAQAWAKYGVAVAGEIAPCTRRRPNVKGLTCP